MAVLISHFHDLFHHLNRASYVGKMVLPELILTYFFCLKYGDYICLYFLKFCYIPQTSMGLL